MRPRKVGILHTAFIGDLALAGALIEGLHAAGHTLVLVTNGAGSALYARDSRVHARVVVNKGRGLAKFRAIFDCAESIRAQALDVLLVPHRSFTSSLIARLSGVPRTVGFEVAMGAFLYDETRPYAGARHESERLLDLAPDDLVPHPARERAARVDAPRLRGDARPEAFFEAFPALEAASARYFVVSPGSVWKTKQYPPEAFAEAARLLLARHPDLVCVLTGGPADAPAVDAFLASASAWDPPLRARLCDASRCVPLADLPLVLARASLSLANDSAPLHVACGVNTPVVGVFGPTSSETGFGPRGARARAVTFATEHGAPLPCQPCSKHGGESCPLGHWRCMRDLPPQAVARAADALLP